MKPGILIVLVGVVVIAPVVGAGVPSSNQMGPVDNTSTEVQSLVAEGASALQSGDFKSALKSFQKADKLANGRSWDAAAGAASASLQLGKEDKALDYAERMLDIDQTTERRGIAHQVMGSCYAQKGMLSKAEGALREALALLPGRPMGTRKSLASVLCKKDNEEEALQLLDDDGLCEQKHDTVVDPSQPGRPIRWELDGPVTEPVRLSGPNPNYPEEARRARIQGMVVMGMVIGTNGEVECVRVLEGLSHGLNCSAAMSVVNWKFSPSTLDGQPIDVYYYLSLRFGVR